MRHAPGRLLVAQTSRHFRTPLPSRWLMPILGLLAMVIQILVVQPHIHAPRTQLVQWDQAGGVVSSPDSPDVSGGRPSDKFPINDDPSNCPLCQVITLASHYVSAAVILIITPTESGTAFAIEVASPVLSSTHSHSWRGRAPPKP
jgi:hypothetical protein